MAAHGRRGDTLHSYRSQRGRLPTRQGLGLSRRAHPRRDSRIAHRILVRVAGPFRVGRHFSSHAGVRPGTRLEAQRDHDSWCTAILRSKNPKSITTASASIPAPTSATDSRGRSAFLLKGKHPGRSLATSGRAGCAGRSKLSSSGIGKVSGFSGFSGISHFRIEPCTLRPKMIQIHASQM
jgi:hypothetical protein